MKKLAKVDDKVDLHRIERKTDLDGTESKQGPMRMALRPVERGLNYVVEKAEENEGQPDAVLEQMHQQ